MNKSPEEQPRRGVNKLEHINLLIAGCSLLLAFVAVIITVLVWIKPFQATTFSPFDKPRPIEKRIRCKGGEAHSQNYQWRIQGDTNCSIELFEGETIVGSSLNFNDFENNGPCFVFSFTGPITIKQLKLKETSFDLYTNSSDDSVTSSLMDSSEKDLRNRTQLCDTRGIIHYKLPSSISIPVSLEDGAEYHALLPGTYTVGIIDGAYSSSPAGYEQVLWRTRTNIYINRPIEWGERLRREPTDNPNLKYIEPTNPDHFLGTEEVYSFENAIKAGKASPSITLHLNRGDVIIFVAIDDKGWYDNPQSNQGYLNIKITLANN